jgi:hypothetical protein
MPKEDWYTGQRGILPMRYRLGLRWSGPQASSPFKYKEPWSLRKTIYVVVTAAVVLALVILAFVFLDAASQGNYKTRAIALADASYYGAVSLDVANSGNYPVNYQDEANQTTPIPDTPPLTKIASSVITPGDVVYVFGATVVCVTAPATDNGSLPALDPAGVC